MDQPTIVTRDEWLVARKGLLLKEKALTHAKDALSTERRRLPMVRVDKQYVFDTPEGRQALGDLFAGRSQLVIYHFMMGPEWGEGCPSCSLLADHLDPSVVHLAQRDVTLVAVSRAPLSHIEAFKRRMGWHFTWASSYGSDFNTDYQVSFTKEEMGARQTYYNYGTSGFPSEEAPGLSVFFKDAAGAIFHTYSTYGRGGEPFIGAYSYLDLVPKGRDEEGLPFPMAWVRHHDGYDAGPAADAAIAHQPAASAEPCCESHGPA